MKLLFSLLFLFSCTSVSNVLPKFQKEKVCSDKALSYLNSKSQESDSKVSDQEIRTKLEAIIPDIKSCYHNQWPGMADIPRIHLCLVMGYDQQGKREFFDFSTKEMTLPLDFQKCINDLSKHPAFKGLKDVKIIQPYNMNGMFI